MHNTIKVVALGYHDLHMNKKCILVRQHESGRLVVNVMQITSQPRFNKSRGITPFMARGLSVNGNELSEEDGEPIELNANEIGCPKQVSPAGIMCRAFAYDETVHKSMLQAARKNPEQWLRSFTYPKIRFEYPYQANATVDRATKRVQQSAARG